jgi:MFS family permease
MTPPVSSPPRAADDRPQSSIGKTFNALKYYNYRLWFFGQGISLVGTWMQSTAQGYLIYSLTQSSAYLGYVGFINGLPSWIFTLFAGVIGDRLPRRNVLIITQFFLMVIAYALGGLVFFGVIQPWHILITAFLTGVANAFDAPTRQAFVVDMVEDRDDLPNAIALNSSMFNLGAMIGPSLGGLLYALVGPGWCFTLNGFSFIAVIIALFLMKLKPMTHSGTGKSKTNILSDIREGVRFVWNEKMVLTFTLGVGLVTLFGMSMMTLMPAWAVKVLGGDVRTNGLLISARGLGALAGALVLANLANRRIKGKLWTIGSLVFPLSIILFSFTHWLPLSMLALMLTGASVIFNVNTANALVQAYTPDPLRGRVMSIYVLVFFGSMPLGSLYLGSLATWIGEANAVLLNGVILAVMAVMVYWLMPQIRKLE